jgi:steroid 5-alpha reductase family enzyme
MMNTKRSLIGIGIALTTAAITTLVGSQGNVLIENVPLFALCSLLIFAIHVIVFIPSFIYKTEHYFDITGSISYVCAVTLAWSLNSGSNTRNTLLGLLVAIWAVRLGSFLFVRVKHVGKDVRFDQLKQHLLSFAMVWSISALWVILTAAAALAAMTSAKQQAMDIFAYLGLAIWLTGFGIEVIADSQKNRFRKNPDNSDTFISTGLWAWSRHPNYLGEIILWVGIAVIAFPVLSGWQYFTLLSPIFVFFLLTKVSGVPMLETKSEKKWGDDETYLAYRNSTPVLFPRWPKNQI